jgi:D-alanine-D-alanine ligase
MQRDVLVVYGGRSTEHDISRRSAAHVLTHLDRHKFRVHAVAIDENGNWLPQNVEALLAQGKGPIPILSTSQIESAGQEVARTPRETLMRLAGLSHLSRENQDQLAIFPILHGTNGEDGTLQGFLQQADVAFVGPDCLGSAIGMDKVVSKRLALAAGVPVVPWVDIRLEAWARCGHQICEKAYQDFGFPLFVKPAQLGSSVGVSKVKNAADLKAACELALQYDDRIMIEKGLNVREIEVGMLGGYEPLASIPGEVIPHADFYSYDAKYVDAEGASMAIPANLTQGQILEAQSLARKVFVGLELHGMARVDLFLEKTTGHFYFNEVNTIPGFTEISQYPLLWKESGIGPSELLTRLIEAGVARQIQRRQLKRSK